MPATEFGEQLRTRVRIVTMDAGSSMQVTQRVANPIVTREDLDNAQAMMQADGTVAQMAANELSVASVRIRLIPFGQPESTSPIILSVPEAKSEPLLILPDHPLVEAHSHFSETLALSM